MRPTSPFWRRSALGFLWREWCWSWNSSTLATSCEELTHWKRLWCWRDWGQEEKGTTEDEMAGWHHWLDGCESEWILGVGDGQGGLPCCNSWGHKESDMTEWLNWTDACLVAQLCPTLYNPMDCSPPSSFIHGDSPGKNTGISCHAHLQGIFPTQESNPGLPVAYYGNYFISSKSVAQPGSPLSWGSMGIIRGSQCTTTSKWLSGNWL